jgi:uncharacterized protein YcaQ
VASATISAASARRIALGAQGFARPRPSGRVDRRHLRRALDDMGLIQIDSVNVLVRSQELPLFARLGPHPRSLIADATADGELFEYWVHEASHVSIEHYPLFRWHMERDHKWRDVRTLEDRRPGFIAEVLQRITVEGPMTSGDFEARVGRKGSWWDWDDAKTALEHLFWSGRLAARRRPNDFARVYDLAERVIPAHVLAAPAPAERDARKELLALAARHHGIGTLADLVDYHRQKKMVCAPLVAELVEEGRLERVRVEGWRDDAFVHPEARRPRSVQARALLSPFDPVVWQRDRAERMFDFHYRIEIYTPAPKRQYGYYVLPFLWGDEIVARVDLKADRQAGALKVHGAFAEVGTPLVRSDAVAGHVELADALAAELSLMAEWLELDRVEVGDRGDLALPVRRAAARYARR